MNGLVEMKKLMEPFGYKTIQEFARIAKLVSTKGFSVNEFLEFAKSEKEEASKDFFEIKINSKGKREIISKRKITESEKTRFLRPGETELLPGVVCDKCHGEVFIEGLCRHNPLVKQGFVRRGICGNCNAEIKVR